MRYLILILPVLLFNWGCSQEKQDKMEMQADQQMQEKEHSAMHDDDSVQMASGPDEKIIYYTCPMEAHKNMHSDKPGECPECGMALVAAVTTSKDKAEFYGCPMETHSHVRSDKPGTCSECGMDLKPMRLDKMGKM